MANKFDRFMESLLLTFAPIMFAASGLFLWLVHGDKGLAAACAALTVTLIIYRVRQKGLR